MAEELQLQDSAARGIISNEIKTNLLVEAGAGSGKTSEMSNRIVSLIENGDREISEIVAITFTKKAANELQERVRKRLMAEFETTKNPYIKSALNKYGNCFIGTIHSFCSKLLRELPIEACVDPCFEELTELDDNHIRDIVLEEYVYSANEENKKILEQLRQFGVKNEVLKDFLRIVCDNQDVVFEVTNNNTTLEEIENKVDDAFVECKTKFISLCDDIVDINDCDDLQKTLLLIKKKIENRREINFEEKLKIIKLFRTSSSINTTQKRWNFDKESVIALQEEIDLYRTNVVLQLIKTVNTYVYNNLLIPFVDKAKFVYQDYKDRNSKLNFQDLLLKTSNMLRDSVEAREYFQKRYKTILVDEFQDTDPIQAQLLMYLVGTDLNEKNWEKIVPKEGALFVVGDPKQSIYSFRRADIDIYRKVKDVINKNGGKDIELTSNFRSYDTLGDWYNYAFDKLLNSSEDKESLQASFSNMHTIKQNLPGSLEGVFFYDVPKRKGKRNVMIEDDIIRVISIIKGIMKQYQITDVKFENKDGKREKIYYKRNIEYKDIMILTRTKRNLTFISQWLAEVGIPVKVTGGNVVDKASSFLILANIIKMLAYPEENAYLHRVLIDFPFGFTKKEITEFVKNGGEFNIHFNFEAEYIKNNLDEETKIIFAKFENAFAKIRQWAYYSKTIPVVSLVEGIVEEIKLERNMLNNNEIGSFTSLLEHIRMNDITDIWGVDRLSDNIKEMLENGFEEENDIEGGDYNAVRLMNLHKAKGLEAPIVILAGEGEHFNNFPTLYIERTLDENGNNLYKGHVRMGMNPGKFSIASDEHILSGEWEKFQFLAECKAELEKDRTLYVAATRAKNVLIMSSTEKNSTWDRLVELLNEDCRDIEDFVKVSFDDWQAEFSEELSLDDIALEIEKINQKRNDFFVNNVASFSNVMASGAKNDAVSYEFSEELIGNLEDLVDKNIISISCNIDTNNETSNMQFGTIVHKLLETEIKNPEAVDNLINQILDNSMLDGISFENLQEIVDKFRKSEIYQRIRNSEKVHTEVPIAVKNEDNMYTIGIIDIIFKEKDNWVIVDYKTCDKSYSKTSLYKKYMSQIGVYKQAWEKITGSKNTKVELCFIEK